MILWAKWHENQLTNAIGALKFENPKCEFFTKFTQKPFFRFTYLLPTGRRSWLQSQEVRTLWQRLPPHIFQNWDRWLPSVMVSAPRCWPKKKERRGDPQMHPWSRRILHQMTCSWCPTLHTPRHLRGIIHEYLRETKLNELIIRNFPFIQNYWFHYIKIMFLTSEVTRMMYSTKALYWSLVL